MKLNRYIYICELSITEMKKISQHNLIFLVAVLLFGCQSKSTTNTEKVSEPISLNSECDCKKYSMDKKINLPAFGDLMTLSDSISLDGDFTNYRIVKVKVDSIRNGYDDVFRDCYKKFGDMSIVNAACSKEEKTKKAFYTALNLMKKHCRGSNQELSKYMATKVNDVVVFLFMSVGENGRVCISGISEIKPDEIMSNNCGDVNRKMAEWEAIVEYKMDLN
jgi:hypothetical protein